MAYEILTESYGRRLPKITAEADSTDDLATLGTNYAEGSTCVIGDKTYSLDKVQGWVEPGSGGGSGGVFWVTITSNDGTIVSDKTAEEIYNAAMAGQDVRGKAVYTNEYSSGINYLELYETSVQENEYRALFILTSYDTHDTQSGATGNGYGSTFEIMSSKDYVTTADWTWEVQDDS